MSPLCAPHNTCVRLLFLSALLFLLSWGSAFALEPASEASAADLRQTLIQALEDEEARERLLQALRGDGPGTATDAL
ncbi:MAG: hypothetical protein KGY40_03355, partial [Thioalkalivibrio sp.]|nr:hypothetical protein [Thioalkalivibrio sp.]